ncbi:MAG: VCBS repeat-containing protein [Planctomycetes bacterium]|nr:VCBS repeat-containing protein [Planctomycetota bacterium]
MDEAAARGIAHVGTDFSASFGDHDRDGWLDLYIGNRTDRNGVGQANVPYRNTGQGHFVDVTAAAGVGDRGPTCAAVFVDYDEDLWPDLLAANDRGAHPVAERAVPQSPRRAVRGRRRAGRRQCRDRWHGVDFVDAFCDGGVDLHVSDTGPDFLLHDWDPAAATYRDLSRRYGMFGVIGWAVNFLDVDNDGWQDVHVVQTQVPNSLFHDVGRSVAGAGSGPDVAFALGLWRFHALNCTVVADFDGEQRFTSLGYAKSHITSLTGVAGPVRLYSDLLLHDVMPAGFRGMAEPGAGAGMFRTPPSWGIEDTAPYLHDGRAEDLDAAIRGHAGEAENVRLGCEALSADAREALLPFLRDL